MKNYIIVAIIIILIIVGVVWYKAKSPATIPVADETAVTTESETPIMTDEAAAPVETAPVAPEVE